MVDICPVGAFTANIDKFTYRSHNSTVHVQLNLFDWSRQFIEISLNAGIAKILPVSVREDRVLTMNSSFPILSDFIRLSLFDMVDFINVLFLHKPTLLDKPKVAACSLNNKKMLGEALCLLQGSLKSSFDAFLSLYKLQCIHPKYNRPLFNHYIRGSTKKHLHTSLNVLGLVGVFSLVNLYTLKYLIDQTYYNVVTPVQQSSIVSLIDIEKGSVLKIKKTLSFFKNMDLRTLKTLKINEMFYTHYYNKYDRLLINYLRELTKLPILYRQQSTSTKLNRLTQLDIFNNYTTFLKFTKVANNVLLFSDTELDPISMIHTHRLKSWHFNLNNW